MAGETERKVKRMRKEMQFPGMPDADYKAPLLSVVKVEVECGFAGSEEELKFLLGAEDADRDGMIY